jgi:hypothetical protein
MAGRKRVAQHEVLGAVGRKGAESGFSRTVENHAVWKTMARFLRAILAFNFCFAKSNPF